VCTVHCRIQVFTANHCACAEIRETKTLGESIEVHLTSLIAGNNDSATGFVQRDKVQFM